AWPKAANRAGWSITHFTTITCVNCLRFPWNTFWSSLDERRSLGLADQQTQESVRVEYRLTGLTCADCAVRFERRVQNSEGVVDAKVNFGASKITIYGKRLSPEEINRLGAFDNIRVVLQDVE